MPANNHSAGLLLFMWQPDGLRVLLVHPGGPFWRNKQIEAWQIPKGRIEAGEDPQCAALREVEEELGIRFEGELNDQPTSRTRGGW